MARSLITALRGQGHAAETASRLVSYTTAPAPERLAQLKRDAATECARLLARWREIADAPQLWLTYHPYYKSPDLLGPGLCAALRIPYVTAEASYAGKRDRDSWAPFQAEVVSGVRMAAVNFAITAQDEEGLLRLLGPRGRVKRLPPFIDTARFSALAPAARRPGAAANLICIAMMRARAKVKSYAFLASALRLLPHLDWRLTIVGDGPARNEVADAFAALPPGRIVWRGAANIDDIPQLLAAADIYAWPGFDEAFGVAYLEAQAAGLPVAALDCGGVADTMQAGETGLLVADSGAPQPYADALARLITDTPLRRQLGAAARRFMFAQRGLAQAGARMQAAIAAIGAEQSQ